MNAVCIWCCVCLHMHSRILKFTFLFRASDKEGDARDSLRSEWNNLLYGMSFNFKINTFTYLWCSYGKQWLMGCLSSSMAICGASINIFLSKVRNWILRRNFFVDFLAFLKKHANAVFNTLNIFHLGHFFLVLSLHSLCSLYVPSSFTFYRKWNEYSLSWSGNNDNEWDVRLEVVPANIINLISCDGK